MFRSERGLCPRNRILGGGSEGGRCPPPSVLARGDLPSPARAGAGHRPAHGDPLRPRGPRAHADLRHPAHRQLRPRRDLHAGGDGGVLLPRGRGPAPRPHPSCHRRALAPLRPRHRARRVPLAARPVAAARGGLGRHLAGDPISRVDRLRHSGEDGADLRSGDRAVLRGAAAPRAAARCRGGHRAGGRAVRARLPHQGRARHAGHRGGRGDRPHARRQRQPGGRAQRGHGLRPCRRRGRLRRPDLLAEPGHGPRAHPHVFPHHHRGRPRVHYRHGAGRPPRRTAGRAARAGMSVKAAALAVLLVALVALPPLAEPYVLHVAIVVLINAVYAEALYVIMRMGYLSFGHAGYIALGAYTSALLATKLGVSPWLGILAGACVAAGFAWLLGLVTLKLRGIYFSLSVFAFAEVVNAVFRAVDAFGGPAGIANVPRPSIGGVQLNGHLGFYYVVLAAAVMSLLFLYRLAATRFGFTLLALRTRDTEALAESVGIASARHKTLAFVTSCFFCGLMGAIHCHYLRFVSPFVFTFFFSTDLVIFNMVGGLGSFWGPLAGSVLLTALGEQLFAAGYYKSLVYALVLLVVILALPGGLIQLLRMREAWAARRLRLAKAPVTAVER